MSQLITSESVTELSKALSACQGEIGKAHKDSNNPFFKSKYADLTSVFDAIREPMAKHGLSIVQFPCDSEKGVGLITRLSHSSGEYMEMFYSMRPTKDDPQGRGSAITYMRRYALQSIMGVAPEDDDGNAASRPAARAPVKPTLNYNKDETYTGSEDDKKWLISSCNALGLDGNGLLDKYNDKIIDKTKGYIISQIMKQVG